MFPGSRLCHTGRPPIRPTCLTHIVRVLIDQEIKVLQEAKMCTVQGHVREQLLAPLLRVPRLVRFSWFDFPANHDVSAMTPPSFVSHPVGSYYTKARRQAYKRKSTPSRTSHFSPSHPPVYTLVRPLPICLQAEAWYRIVTTSQAHDQLRQPNFRTTTPNPITLGQPSHLH